MNEDLTDLDDAALDRLGRDVIAEQERRAIIAESEQRLAEVSDTYQRAIGRRDGDEYVPPMHALDAYRHGAIVAVGERWFRSRHHANVWDPLDPHGAQWWQEVWQGDDGEWLTEDPTGDIPVWDPATTYYQPATVEWGGVIYDLIHAAAAPGTEPGAPASWAVWRAREEGED